MTPMIAELTEKAFRRLERDTLLTRLNSPA